MKTLLHLSMYLLLTCTSYSQESQNYVFHQECGLFGCTTEVKSPSNINSIAIADSNSSKVKIIATGQAATNITQQKNSSIDEPQTTPEKRKNIKIFTKHSFIGSFYELIPNSSIYIGNRHLLQELKIEDLHNSFEYQNLSFNDFSAIEFYDYKNSLSKADVIIVAPKTLINSITKHKNLNEILSTQNKFKTFTFDELYRQSWFSWQYGTINNQITEQYSQGKVSRISVDKKFVWLDGDSNNSSPRSSSSLVWVTNSYSKSWNLLAIVECIDVDINKKLIPRALLLSYIAEQEMNPISFNKLIEEPRLINNSCIQIDGRGAGGL